MGKQKFRVPNMKRKLILSIFSAGFLLYYYTICASAGLLRTGTKNIHIKSDPVQRRKLAWIFVSTGDVVDNNESYDFYDSMPKDAEYADRPDKLRTTDLCYKDGTYSLSNCPVPPDCSWSGKFGPAKLCINRAPRPDWVFYVAIMKCIPAWENCDKCLCGQMTSEREDSSCVPQDDCGPNDDTLSFSCEDRRKIKFQGHRWDVPDKTIDLTVNSIPTSMPTTKFPTARPTTDVPTPLPTTKLPTAEPTTDVPTPLPTTKLPTATPTTDAPTPLPTTKLATDVPKLLPTTKLPTANTAIDLPTPLPTTKLPTQIEVMNKTLFATPMPTSQLPNELPADLTLNEQNYVFTQSHSTIQLMNVTITKGVFGGDIIVQRNYEGSW